MPSMATRSPFSNTCTVVLRKKSLRLLLLNDIYQTLHTLFGSLKGRLASQSFTFILLQLPVLQPPLLLHPATLPPSVPHELHPMLYAKLTIRKFIYMRLC